MSTLTFNEFDLLFKDLFHQTSTFTPTLNSKQPHPVNIFYDDEGLHFEVACTGLTKKDVEVKVEEDILKIVYNNEDEKGIHPGTIVRTLSKKSFNLAYKISSKYDLTQISANLDNGLLQLYIPISEKSKTQVIKIK
jgi:HSP20 family molecular chaperone IbpA